MDAFLVAVWVLAAQAVGVPAPVTNAPVSNAIAPAAAIVVVKTAPKPPRCDARPYQRLVGRTVSDLLTARLPQGSRIYRIDDPQTEPVVSGRLSVELNRSTRVRRVYCS
jgi:hypothetical protein